MNSRTKHVVLVLALVLCSAATNYAQQPPQSVCNHQWVPSGEHTSGLCRIGIQAAIQKHEPRSIIPDAVYRELP